MEQKFSAFLKDPIDRGELQFFPFEKKGENILHGVLVNPRTFSAYPILNGVPVMLPAAFNNTFISKYKDELERVNESFQKKIQFVIGKGDWSFSLEWESHFKDSLDTTWGWSTQSRFQQFLLETETTEKDLGTKLILDAGCGNGMLTELISGHGPVVLGLDLSDSVFLAEANRKSTDVCFIKGDLQKLPFADELFDISVSNGVIHHTPHTETTFHSIARTIKTSGKFYVWLYSRKGGWKWRVKRRFFDASRVIVCRMPAGIQKMMVSIYTNVIYIFNKSQTKGVLRISMFDSITPRWRYYHTPEEVAHWYHKAGYGPTHLTHFDNRYGFGVCAVKGKMEKTPGEHHA